MPQPIDGIFRSDSASSKNVVIDPALVTTAKSLIFGAVTSKAFTIGSGFTKAGDTGGIYPIYQITSAAGSYSTLGTSSGTWRGLLIAYKAAP